MKISSDLLMYFLYGRSESDNAKGPIPVVSSLPSDITIGHSMIPGAEYGVFARQHISKDLIVGPLNIPLGQKTPNSTPMRQEDRLIHESWSWLKYIQPARHPFEENARIDETPDGIYFRVTHNITAGCEILAWFTEPSLHVLDLPPTKTPVSSPKSNPPSSPYRSPAPLVPTLLTGTPHKPVCRLCGETYTSFVELWSHVTSSHTIAPGSGPLPSTVLPTSTALPSSSTALPTTPSSPLPLYNYHIPFNNIMPLNMSTPIAKPYPMLSPRVHSMRDTSPTSDNVSDDILATLDCRDTERPYECGHCGKSFSLPSSLRRHIITHTGERPYKCGYCGRAFAGATTLNNHIRIHTGEKPHVCHDCGAGFTQATQLNRHIRCCPNSKGVSQHQGRV